MNYEEKYKSALKWMQSLYGGLHGATKEEAEKYFPELKESEDERIRKWLIGTIKQIPDSSIEWETISKSDVLAWLEKQGQTFTKKDVDDAYLEGITDTKNEMEKQYEANYQIRKDIATFIFNYRGDIKDRAKWMNYLGIKVSFVEKQDEQNHCMIQWKGDNLKEVIDFTGKDKNFEKWFKSFEEYEKYVQEHDGIFKLFNADGSHYEVPVGAWIVKTPDGYNVASKAVFKQKSVDTPKFKVEQTSTWSEEDEKIGKELMDFCIKCSQGHTIVNSQDDFRRWATWLNSLKPQLKNEWSKEDEREVAVLEAYIRSKDWSERHIDRALGIVDELVNKAKSPRPQNTWKPSDEQMQLFKEVCDQH